MPRVGESETCSNGIHSQRRYFCAENFQVQGKSNQDFKTILNGNPDHWREPTGNRGKAPRTAVIDSGASSIILGKSFSEQLARCRPEELIFGDTFVTAGGTTETCVGRTKNGLSFTLARGTRVQTTIVVPVIIANTDAYDVILGMDFLGPLFA